MRSKLGNILIPFLLLGVLFSPSIGQWVHLADAHHAEVECTEGKVHLHTTEVRCELTATFTTPYAFQSLKTPKFSEVNTILLQPIGPIQTYTFQQIQFFRLRGPPQLLTLV